MKRFGDHEHWRLACTALAWITLTSAAFAIDRVKLRSGSQQTGDITATTAQNVTVEVGATTRTVAVNEIESIEFGDEPAALAQARLNIKSGRYPDAAALLGKIPPNELKRPLVAQEVQFLRALATARAALAGDGSINDAGHRMLAFEKGNPNSPHYYEACEVLGDLLIGMRKYPAAEAYYKKLAAAPWPEYKMRAAVLTARALVGQQKYDQAIARFDQVIGSSAKGAEAADQKVAATLGKAEALSASGKPAEAIELVDRVVERAGADEEQILARAYNVKGACLEAAGKIKPAIVAYLHVDLLYPKYPEQHAEALSHLAKLFAADSKNQRAQQARTALKAKYPQSVWASQ